MNKQRKRRVSDYGQYLDPSMNELEWLDETPGAEPPPAENKTKVPVRTPAGNNRVIKKKKKTQQQPRSITRNAKARNRPRKNISS